MGDTEALFNDAMTHFGGGRFGEAIAAYRNVLAADDGHPEAWRGLGMAYFRSEQFDEAIEATKRLIALKPDDVLAHTTLSMIYQRKGLIAEAEAEAGTARTLGWKAQLAQSKRPPTDTKGESP